MENIRIQDDLYHYVNQEKLDELVIPDHMPITGGFATLSEDVEKLMIGEFNEMSETENYPNDYLKRACTLFKMAKNVERKAQDGIAPALKKFAVLKSLKTMEDLNAHMKDFVLNGISLPFSVATHTDMKNTSVHCVILQGPGVILPDTSYYKEEMAQQKMALIGLWSNMASAVLSQTDLTEEEQKIYLADTLAFDEMLAKLVKSNEEWSEYVKSYNPMSTARVCNLVQPLDFKPLLKGLFGKLPKKIIVAEPRYFKAFNEVFNENTLSLYFHWAYVLGIIESCSFLSEELRDLGGMYHRAITGVKVVSPIEKFSYQLASSVYSEPVGLYYGEKYFGEEAKKDIVEIVHQIIDTYKSRIEKNDFLEQATKDKAILKLSKMGVKMGYPDKVDEFYDQLVYDETASFFDAIQSIAKIRKLHGFSKLYKEVNREKWAMPGHMVNACYNPTVNDITFPAAILQAPFYSIKQTRSENLGGIGAVIGHEISHAFDSNGAKCDENGNLNNWWTKEDNKKFNQKIKAMVKQFDGIELPWGKVNGKFIVSENIADNGGMAVTVEIMSKTKNSSFEEYFKNWARVWCAKAKPEYLQLLLKVDVHGPAILRANMPPRNFQEWYDTFGVKKTDKMYIAPSKRVVIW